MKITDERLDEFIAIYKERFGVELSKEEALPKAQALMNVMWLIYKPMTEEQKKNVSERQLKLLD